MIPVVVPGGSFQLRAADGQHLIKGGFEIRVLGGEHNEVEFGVSCFSNESESAEYVHALLASVLDSGPTRGIGGPLSVGSPFKDVLQWTKGDGNPCVGFPFRFLCLISRIRLRVVLGRRKTSVDEDLGQRRVGMSRALVPISSVQQSMREVQWVKEAFVWRDRRHEAPGTDEMDVLIVDDHDRAKVGHFSSRKEKPHQSVKDGGELDL